MCCMYIRRIGRGTDNESTCGSERTGAYVSEGKNTARSGYAQAGEETVEGIYACIE